MAMFLADKAKVGHSDAVPTFRMTRSRRRHIAEESAPPADDSSDEGVAPPPTTSSVGSRRRGLRKRLQVVSEDETDEEKIEQQEELSSSSDSDNPINRMEELVRLPIVVVEVRELGERIVGVCDELEKLLTGQADDDESEMDELKKKLTNLTEQCFQKVQSGIQLPVNKPAQKSRPAKVQYKRKVSTVSKKQMSTAKNTKATEETDSDHSAPKGRVTRSNSVDYTEYIPTGDPVEQKTTRPLPLPPVEKPMQETRQPSTDESAKDSGNPSSAHEESVVTPSSDFDCCNPMSPAPLPYLDEPETIRETHDERSDTRIDDITDPSDDLFDQNLFRNSDVNITSGVEDSCQSGFSQVEDSVINDDIFTTRSEKPDSFSTPINHDAVPLGLAVAKSEQLEEHNFNGTPHATGIVTRRTVQRRLLTVAASNLKASSPPSPAESLGQNSSSENASTSGSVARLGGTIQTTVRVKPDPENVTFYQPEPTSSKVTDTKLVRAVSVKAGKAQFSTNCDPNPNREPTAEEIRYIVPHLPKFSVQQVSQGENFELSIMKKEIEMRLRINDLSWVTQRAIREESSRMKKVKRNNEELQKQIARFEHVLPPNQLLLDYDQSKKTFIRVHPELAMKLKPHQMEGIKFMYDCCYGSISDIKGSAGSGCILAHCMGLGKTLQVIALINTVICYPMLNTKRIIVVCPKSTVMNWAQEIRTWLGDIQCEVNLQLFYLPDSSNIYKKLEVLRGFHAVTGKNAHCLMIGYEAFRSLVFYDARNKNGEMHSERIRTEIRRMLINPGADLIVLDEGHIIKNRKSQTNLSLAEVATKRRIILTGTPIQNNLNEYFCMVSFIKPAYLGNEREFNEQYAKPIKDGQHKDSDRMDIRIMKMKSYILHTNLLDFVQRKEFTVLEHLLPKKYEYVLYVPLTPVQEDLYEQYLRKNPYTKEWGGRSLLEDYTFLRKIWTHPIVLERAWETAMKKKYGVQEKRRAAKRVRGFDSSSEDDDDNDADNARSITNVWWKQIISADDLESLFPSNKMLLLFEILRMCQERGEKCLIFSGFVMVLNMVEHFMKMIDEQDTNKKAQLYGFSRFRGPWRPGMDYYRIDGGTSKSTRHEMINKFNDTKNRVTRVFLISTKAGGQGINLVGANRVVILDTSWNPAVDQQGIFRVYRLGQEKTCYIYRLLAIHTMEEKVYSRAVTKQAMSHRVTDKKQVDRNYNMAELRELYHFERVDMGARPNAVPAEDDMLSALLWNHHKLIYRYHTHEKMLDNKTEQDLTDWEKKLAWDEFKQKGKLFNTVLGIGDDHTGEVGKTSSQLSEHDSELLQLFEKACAPDNEDIKPNVSIESSSPPLVIPVRRSVYTKVNEKLLDVEPDPVEDDSTIFGEDPYREMGFGGISIIEEQKKKLGFKLEPETPTLSQVSVTEEEVGLLRSLEEDNLPAASTVQVKQEPPEPLLKDAALDAPVLESVDLVNLSYESNDEALKVGCDDMGTDNNPCTEPSSPAPSMANEYGSLSSLIEYDPVTSSQDNFSAENTQVRTETEKSFVSPGSVNITEPPSSYEKFKANLKENPAVATSTATPAVVLIASSPAIGACFERVMTRGMKRKIVPSKGPTGQPKKSKMFHDGDFEIHFERSDYYNNQCRSLVPYGNQTRQRVQFNQHLEELLAQNVSNLPPNNMSCRALVPYRKRVSLLEDILSCYYVTIKPARSTSQLDIQVEVDANEMETTVGKALCQTATLSWGGEDVNLEDFDDFSEDIGRFYTAEEELDASIVDSDRLTLTQCTPSDSQQTHTQQVLQQNEDDELMNSLEELRVALSDEIVADSDRSNCSAVVPYNPPISLWDQPKYENKQSKSEASAAAVNHPIQSLSDHHRYDHLLYPESKRPIIKIQRNKRYRFLPYDKNERKWRKIRPLLDGKINTCLGKLPQTPTMSAEAFEAESYLMHPKEETPTQQDMLIAPAHSYTCTALVPYTGNCVLSAIKKRISGKLNIFMFHTKLDEYLTFCRNVTHQSTSRGTDAASPDASPHRGMKRKLEWTRLSQRMPALKRQRPTETQSTLLTEITRVGRPALADKSNITLLTHPERLIRAVYCSDPRQEREDNKQQSSGSFKKTRTWFAGENRSSHGMFSKLSQLFKKRDR